MVDQEEVLEKWLEWEKDNDLYSPDRIENGRDRDRELFYTLDRLEKELEEAAEVAEKYENFLRKGEFSRDILDYTEMIDRDYEEDEKQLGDELGYEIADIALFCLKTKTILDGEEPNSENISKNQNLRSPNYADELSELREDFNPDSDESFANNFINSDLDRDDLRGKINDTCSVIYDLTEDLDREFWEYLDEKIEYNKERNLSEMDTDFETREKWSDHSIS